MNNMVFDIRTSEYAQNTLTKLTGVPLSIWEGYLGRENEYKYVDYLVEDVINSYGQLPNDYRDFEFRYFHVTTSANECAAIKKYGLLDLKQAYFCPDSELRIFLENHNVNIDIAEQVLTHNGNEYDISYAPYAPRHNTKEYSCWAIGRKFYYDYTTCGFLSVWERSPYGGQVHHRPEILMDIDNLLGLQLSQEWARTRSAYEVVAKVSGDKIVYDGDEEQSETDKVLNYLTKAYLTAFAEPTEEILLLKNRIQVPPEDIIEIKPLRCWRTY